MDAGKKFEEQFKKSIPDHCWYHRLRDSAMSYNNSGATRFTWQNECDFFLFDTVSQYLYALELKSTKYNSISFETQKNGDSGKMIPYHQIQSLYDMNRYKGIIPAFIFNFRNEDKGYEKTFFQTIHFFIKMIQRINKKSFNIKDLENNNALEIIGEKKRVNYIWDIEELLNYYRTKGEVLSNGIIF